MCRGAPFGTPTVGWAFGEVGFGEWAPHKGAGGLFAVGAHSASLGMRRAVRPPVACCLPPDVSAHPSLLSCAFLLLAAWCRSPPVVLLKIFGIFLLVIMSTAPPIVWELIKNMGEDEAGFCSRCCPRPRLARSSRFPVFSVMSRPAATCSHALPDGQPDAGGRRGPMGFEGLEALLLQGRLPPSAGPQAARAARRPSRPPRGRARRQGRGRRSPRRGASAPRGAAAARAQRHGPSGRRALGDAGARGDDAGGGRKSSRASRAAAGLAPAAARSAAHAVSRSDTVRFPPRSRDLPRPVPSPLLGGHMFLHVLPQEPSVSELTLVTAPWSGVFHHHIR